MAAKFNSVKAYEKLINMITDEDGNLIQTSKKFIEVCEFLEIIFNEGFDSKVEPKTILNENGFKKNGEFDLLNIRRKYKLTQTAFAKKIGLSRGAVSQIELGYCRITKVNDLKINDFLNTNPL